MIQFYSTNNTKKEVSLKEAVLRGIADDGGLFMPDRLFPFEPSYFHTLPNKTLQEVGYDIIQHLFEGEIPDAKLSEIVNKSITFDAPLVKICDGIYTVELFHGPTLSFKDFGARFMARLLEYFAQDGNTTYDILVATSGDTGSAVGHAFHGVEGVRIWILYPKGKVTEMQEKQITSIGGNVTALEVEGSFDDCQSLVKEAFADKQLREKRTLTSANSINIARLIPQTFYYFHAYGQLRNKGVPAVVSVPSGNFGNLVAGLLAKRMGLPIAKFVGATNVNNTIPEYLNTSIFRPRPSKMTISNAMDVGNPSNFARMLDLFGHDAEKMRHEIYGVSISENETKEAIQEVYRQYGYVMDPHGSVGYCGLRHYLGVSKLSLDGIFLETAHPAKFLNTVQPLIEEKIIMPDRLQIQLNKKKEAILISNRYADLKQLLTKPPA